MSRNNLMSRDNACLQKQLMHCINLATNESCSDQFIRVKGTFQFSLITGFSHILRSILLKPNIFPINHINCCLCIDVSISNLTTDTCVLKAIAAVIRPACMSQSLITWNHGHKGHLLHTPLFIPSSN